MKNKKVRNLIIAIVGVFVIVICAWLLIDKFKLGSISDAVNEKISLNKQEKLMKEYKDFADKNISKEEQDKSKNGVSYEISNGDAWGEEIFTKYDNDKKIWSVTFENSLVYGYDFIGDDILVYGDNYCNSSELPEKVWMARLDADGNIIWKKTFENGYDEDLMSVMVDGESIHAIIRVEKDNSRIPWFITLMEVNGQGEVCNYAVTDIEGGVIDAVKGSDCFYFIFNPGYFSGDTQKVIKLNTDGTYDVILECEIEEKVFDICDIETVNDKLYISVTETAEEDFDRGAYDFYDVNHSNIASDGMSYFDEGQLKTLKDKYTAKLYEFNEVTEKYKEIYEKESALGRGLDVNDKGQLVWNLQTMEKALYSLATSSYTVETVNFEYEYVFDEEGNLISNEKKKWAVFYRW